MSSLSLRNCVLGRLTLVAAAGGLTALAFPPYDLAWLLPLGPAALAVATYRVRPWQGFWLGIVFGFVFLVVLMPWLTVVGVDAWLGLSLIEALFYGLLGWGLARISRLAWWPLWSACLWVGVELLRGLIPWGGFNWGRLAFASTDLPVGQAVAYIGAPGLSFLLAFAGGLLAWAVLRANNPGEDTAENAGKHGKNTGTDSGRRRAAVDALTSLAAAVAVFLLPGLVPTWSTGGQDEEKLTIAVVQGNVPGSGLNPFAERRAVLNNHVRATHQLAADVRAGRVATPDLVLWPENSTDIDPFKDPTVMADISAAVTDIGVPTLVGAMVGGPGPIDVENQGIVWMPASETSAGGPGQSYSKMHPVPFGEYIPMRKFLAQHIKRLDEIPRDMVAGTRPGLLSMAGVPVGDVICFEVIYDDLVRTVVDQGAELLVVQTNNATYMGTGQVDQQFQVSRLRARETGRYVAVAATNGISAIVNPDGEAIASAPKKTTTVLVEEVRRLRGITPSVGLGRWPELALTAVAAAAVAFTFRRRTTPAERDALASVNSS